MTETQKPNVSVSFTSVPEEYKGQHPEATAKFFVTFRTPDGCSPDPLLEVFTVSFDYARPHDVYHEYYGRSGKTYFTSGFDSADRYKRFLGILSDKVVFDKIEIEQMREIAATMKAKGR